MPISWLREDITMFGETEPEIRKGHVAVRLEHYILILGGEVIDTENSEEFKTHSNESKCDLDL